MKDMRPVDRAAAAKAGDNQDMKSRYNENFEMIMAEDRKKVRQKVSQMRQEQPNGEVDVKLNQRDILRVNPFDQNIIGPTNSN